MIDGQLMFALEDTVASWNGITQSMVTGVFDGIKELLPILAPAIFGLWGFRKGWSFLRSLVHGA